jgi:CRISPR-associated endonuclease/helicase Cas3
MSNYYKSVESLLNETSSINGFLVSADKYFAHIPAKETINGKPELLSEHIELVQDYLKRLVNAQQLDNVIDTLIYTFLSENNITNNAVGQFIKKLFVDTIVFHDFGKINENFQAHKYKMNNPFFKGKETADSPISTHHSSLGAFLYISKKNEEIYKQFNQREQSILILATVVLSYSILKHHSSKLNNELEDTVCFKEDNIPFLKKYIDKYQFSINQKLYPTEKFVSFIFTHPNFKFLNSFSLYSLLRLNFSLLTASDYLATNEYMSGFPVSNFGLLSKERIEEIYKNVSEREWINQAEKKENYNRDTYQKLHSFEFKNPKAESGINLNILRQEMAIEIIRNIRVNIDKNLFYIEAPTGGGKTNLSMLAAIELLRNSNGSLNKVFYVFPFTTLITQTYKAIVETLGLNEDEVVELHSKAGFKTNEKEEDSKYGSEKKNYLDNLFVNYPFCLLTHIKFFDLLKTNEKEANYLLHRLANSVVVIDELQSYNPEHWDKIIFFIKKYAKAYNIKFILMSATLPKLDKLNVIKDQVDEFVYLLPKSKENYFRNPNFCKRVNFNFDLLDNKELSLKELSRKLIEESKNYAEKDFGKAKPLKSVYTIIEFIFKKSATLFYEEIKDHGFFDEIFVLSGTILEHRRKEIINYLKNKSNRKKRILLITTQVVEAGVDIDMDLGFKDRSLIDSDEQLAGRINRNVNKKDCTLFLFNYNKEAIIYGKDKRFELTNKNINRRQYEEILLTKNFDYLYDLVMNDKNDWNLKTMAVGFSEYESKINNLRFQSVQEDFKLIDQNNISCFIPLAIPVIVKGATDNFFEKTFSDGELEFLKSYNIFPNAVEKIEGILVFDLYLKLIENKQDFMQKKIDNKKLQGIMSKFIFSLFASPKIEKQLIHFSDEEKSKYGYKYIERWNEFYDETFGMKDADFNSNETQFL